MVQNTRSGDKTAPLPSSLIPTFSEGAQPPGRPITADIQVIRELAKHNKFSPDAHIKVLEALLVTMQEELRQANTRIEELGGELFITSEALARERESRAAAEIAKSIDALTGLSNRGAFDEELENILNHLRDDSAANDNKKKTCLVFIDIDGLKQTNDHYGHDAGDKILLLLTGLLKQTLRSNDKIYRVGGDEIVIKMEGDPETIHQRILQMQLACETKHIRVEVAAEWKDIPVWGFSFGTHQINKDQTAAENYKAADAAMYTNKSQRKEDQREVREQRLVEMATDKQKIKDFEAWLLSGSAMTGAPPTTSFAP